MSLRSPSRKHYTNRGFPSASRLHFTHALLTEGGRDVPGDEAVDIAAQAGDLLHQAGAEELVILAGHEADKLQLRVELAVEHGHLELTPVVSAHAHAAH